MEGPKVVFHLVDDAELPPMTINYNDNLEPVVYLNMHHHLWLALARNMIPGIAMNLQSRLSMMCDNHLTEQIRMSAWNDDSI